ncbi:flagellar type III secretion system pore protein FliP [Sporobacter termitidis]|uniref:flagellar type III secretion system pore protein FliP n=1 Tax=Sporobacter termitidis TaxID=44749 RepID=UPI001FA8F988|nr:flagellar type III secretion system pore protein FliP [Sporobacter termitidis]
MKTVYSQPRLPVPDRGATVWKKVMKTAKICLGTSVAFIICVAALTAVSRNASAAPFDTIKSLLDNDQQSLQIIMILTAITLIPTMLIMLTGFTRIIIVLSIVRNAIGLQNMPPNTVIIGLAIFITYFVMSPVLTQINDVAYQPYIKNEIQFTEFSEKAMEPIRDFMLKETYQSDLGFFEDLAKIDASTDVKSVPDHVIIASFITSELKHAFAIGFFIYIPFIVIDMIVASTLMAMGMMMLPPAMISMPFKILLFVLVDGWKMTIGTLINSF